MAKAKNDEEVVEAITNQEVPEEVQAAEEQLNDEAPANETTEDSEQTEKVAKPVKAGPKARKAVAEAKEAEEAAEEKPKSKKGPAPKTRSKLERRGKKFREAAKLIDFDKTYELKEAIDLATKTSPVKFDASVELHIRLNVDPRHADQNIRDSLVLPHGTGKSIRVAVFAPADQHEKAKSAGADVVGEDDFLQQLEKGKIDFDLLISTPQTMAKLGKYAKLLGPKGLMPNPKSGTVTADVATAVKEAKAGRVEYRVDQAGIVHAAVGKVSFGTDKLVANAEALVASIKAAKPASVKGNYIENVAVASTMGPGIRVSL